MIRKTPYPSNMPPPVEGPPPATIPDPLYIKDPILFSHTVSTLQTVVGLDDSDRLVLLGVLQHIPNTSYSFISRVLSLPSHQLRSLATLFTAGLLEVRGWGGRKEAGGSRSSSQLPSPAYCALFASLLISPFPTPAIQRIKQEEEEEEDQEGVQGLGLELYPTSPLLEPSRQQSEKPFPEHQLNRCPITGRGVALDHIALIPHSVAALSESATPVWLLLAVCLGPSLRNDVYDLIRDGNSYSTTNTLLLDPTIHRCYNSGFVFLSPVLPDNTFNPDTTSCYDVRFRWRSNPEDLKTLVTSLPAKPEVQSPAHVLQARPIQDNDRFRLFTNDPETRPLPHPLLFSLHAMLWRMIGSSGLTECEHSRHKDIATVPEPDHASDPAPDPAPDHAGNKRKRRNVDTDDTDDTDDDARERTRQRGGAARAARAATRNASMRGRGYNADRLSKLLSLPEIMGRMAKSLTGGLRLRYVSDSEDEGGGEGGSDSNSDSEDESGTESGTEGGSDSDSRSGSDTESETESESDLRDT